CWAEVNGYDRNMDKGFEDWEFTIAVGKKGWSIFVIPEILFNYRNIPNSRNKKARLNYPDLRRYVYKKHKDLLTQNIEGTIDNFLDEIGTQNFQIEKLRNSRNYRIWKTFKQMENKLKNIFENRNVRN
ncbi:glycosyltransferase family 2 protein, partial [Longispora fulva]|uniref:glycosyltransferase family 2 protein n=2 Tax=Bacteria TaxID=2 RepID=UPI0036356A84